MQDPRIDFIIIGTEKAGTGFLAAALKATPGVYMPAGEVRYFRDPFFGPPELLAAEVGDPGDAGLVGIKHPSYLAYPDVPERVRAHCPDARLIVTLRDPVERMISAYFHYVRSGQIPPVFPEDGLARLLEDREASPKYADIAGFGLYHRHLIRWVEQFPRDRFLVLEYERLATEPEPVASLFAFLGLEPRTVDRERRVNEGSYDWPACVLAHHRSRVSRRYDDKMNVMRLESGEQERVYDANEVAGMFDEVAALRAEHSRYDGISEGLRERIRDHYRDDVRRLKADGFLQPVHWANFDPK